MLRSAIASVAKVVLKRLEESTSYYGGAVRKEEHDLSTRRVVAHDETPTQV